MSERVQRRLLLVVMGLGLLSVAGLYLVVSAREPRRAEQLAHTSARSLEPLWPAPQFAYRDQRGELLTPASLKGRPWVANFIFTECRSICPLLTVKMVQLQRGLAGVDARFVSFSVDPENDTPERLAAYAQSFGPGETRWHLLRTERPALAETLRGFKVVAQAVDAGVDRIVHSSVFVLVDRDGAVRGVFDSEDPEDFGGLEDAVRRLAGTDGPRRELPVDGAALYAELSCAACHDRADLAPPLHGVFGTRRELDTSIIVTADEPYLVESILRPGAKRVKGYPLQMPTYEGLVDEPALTRLVSYVKSLEAPPRAPAVVTSPITEVATDPVCGMEVRVTSASPRLTVDGKTYHFCSTHCLDQFEREHGG